MSKRDILYIDNDNIVELLGLKNNITGQYIKSSTNVTAKLEKQDGTELVAARSLTYVADSDGDYRASWDKDLLAGIAEDNYYLVYVVAESGLDLKIKHWVRIRDRVTGR